MTHSSARMTLIQLFICFCVITMMTRFCPFVAGIPFFFVMTEQDVWNANKQAILSYVPGNKDLKLIWEKNPKTERIIRMFQSLRALGTEDAISFTFGGRLRTFYVLNIPNKNIHQFQRRVRTCLLLLSK